jgi:transglutaminase-like putative cysteine protease
MVALRSDSQRPEEPVLLTIRHLTTYRYRQPVAFGEHRMMFRPRESPDLRLLDARLAIDPEPVSLRSTVDGYGNHIGIAAFSGRATTLTFESIVRVEQVPAVQAVGAAAWPPASSDHAPIYGTALYSDEGHAALRDYLAPAPIAPDDPVADFARRFLGGDAKTGTWALLCRLSDGIHQDFAYRRREAKGVQSAAETLALGHGSCRDFAVLMIAAARSLGFAARFASGYLAGPLDPSDADGEIAPGAAGGATHAWAQVYLPRLGWVDFDPTSRTVGRQGLVTVALVAAPEEATPLHGTFLGFPSDNIGMDVAVTITAGA